MTFPSKSASSSALNESQKLLHSVIEGTSDAIYAKDLFGRYVLFNSAAARLYQTTSEQVIGNDDSLILPTEEAARR